MTIRLKKRYENGWKRNNPDDKVLVAVFIDEKTGKELFSYAPSYNDIIFWKHLFRELIEYEFGKSEKLYSELDSCKIMGSSSKSKDNFEDKRFYTSSRCEG